jgi:hypothetical protein
MERKATAHFELGEVWINPDSILQIKPDIGMKNNLAKGYLPKDIDQRQDFSCLQYGNGNNVSSAVVVGSPEMIVEKIYKSSGKEVLRG